MIKKFISKIFVCLFLVMFTCGCGHKNSVVTVQFASWGSKSEIDIIKPLLSDFEKENPDIKVDFMHIPQNYFQKIHLLFASNTPPDVIFINNLYLPVYANAGVLEEIEDWSELNFYDRNILKSMSWHGKLYAIPRDVSNLVIFYNKNLFDKYGVKYPQSNWTMEDFIKTSKELTRDGIFGVSFEEKPIYYLPYLMSNGGGILSDDLSEVIIDSSYSKEGLNFYSDLRKKYHVAPRAEESASATMAQMFLQQKLAMHMTGRWLVPKYREEAKFDWDIVEFPKGKKGSIVSLDSSGWAITKNSRHKKEAYKLVEYLSSKESIQKITESGLIVPARSDVANSKYFLDGKKPKHSDIFLKVIKTAKPTPVSVNYNEITDDLSGKLEHLFR